MTVKINSSTAKAVAADITKYGGVLVAVLEVIANVAPQVSVPAAWQGVIDAVIGVVTALMSIRHQQQVSELKANLALRAAKKK